MYLIKKHTLILLSLLLFFTHAIDERDICLCLISLANFKILFISINVWFEKVGLQAVEMLGTGVEVKKCVKVYCEPVE